MSLAPLPMAESRVRTLAQIEAEKLTGSPYPRCSLWLRFGARASDLVLASAIFWLGSPRFGAVLAILYLLLADGMFDGGQSIGKKIFGVRVVHLPTRSSGRKRDSTLRNAPLALPVLLGMMPEVGLVAFVAGAVVIGAVEAWRVVRDPLGLRFGDVWAQTQVVDGKVVAGAAAISAATDRAAVTERAAGKWMVAARLRREQPVRRRRRIRCGLP